MNALRLLSNTLQTCDKWLSTRKTRSYGATLTGLMIALFLFTNHQEASAQGIVCRDDVHVGIGPWCKATLSANQFVTYASGTYSLEIVGTSYDGVLPYDVYSDDVVIGQVYSYIITKDGYTCDSGKLTFHDYVGPQCGNFDPTIYAFCSEDLDAAFTGPGFTDCSDDFTVSHWDDVEEGCDLGYHYGYRVVKIITRTWSGLDVFGNQNPGTCSQVLYVLSPGITEIKVTPTLEIECDKNVPIAEAIDPSNLEIEYLPHILVDGVPQAINSICKYAISKSDTDPVLYNGNKYKVFRTWNITNWCTYESKSILQTILFVDNTDPVIYIADEITLEANVFSDDPYKLCEHIGSLPSASATDNCTEDADITISIYISLLDQHIPNGGMLPAGLPYGDNYVTYKAVDQCGRSASKIVKVKVVDTTKPIAICTPTKNIGIIEGSTTSVDADFFENGSTDNCCIDRFEVRRADAVNGDMAFDHHVDFYCDDDVVTVIFRAYDCAGNFNDCTLEVTVQDLIKPTITAPENAEDDCMDVVGIDLTDINILQQRYGVPVVMDNCPGATFKELDPVIDLLACEGQIIHRSFYAIDAYGNVSAETVTQDVEIYGISRFAVTFQSSLELDCSEDIPLTNPVVTNLGCGEIFTRYQDVIYNQDEGACYKLIRTWEVLDWCAFEINQTNDGSELVEFPDVNGLPHLVEDGYIKFVQEIRITDSEAPVITGIPNDLIIKLNEDCDGSATIPSVVVTDNNCDGSASVVATINGLIVQIGTQITGSPGEVITVKYVAVDGCNNYSEPVYVDISFIDSKKPTPICLNLSTEIGNGGDVLIWASDFESGSSYDNCGLSSDVLINKVIDANKDGNYSDDAIQSPPYGKTSITFTCADIGHQIVQYWIKDNAGNWEFCLTGIFISDADDDDCANTTANVSGLIQTEDGNLIEQVEVQIDNPSMPSIFTGFDGFFNFAGLNNTATYNITPKKDLGHGNGISTYDMVLMQRHILGVSELNTPYKILAADVNNSGGISTGDLVELRKLILGVSSDFSKTESWHFVPADYVFQNPTNPMQEEVPISVSVQSNMEVDFIGFKMGDLNLNADASKLLGDEDDLSPVTLLMENQSFKAGDIIEIPVKVENEFEVLGIGLSLHFDQSMLELETVESHTLTDFNDASYHAMDGGYFNIAWANAYAEKINKEEAILTLRFVANARGSIKEALSKNSERVSTLVLEQGVELEERLIFTKIFDTPETIKVYQNVPNPFVDETIIRIDLPKEQRLTLDIIDIAGKRVYNLDSTLPKGENQILLNAHDLPESGIYYYRVKTGEFIETKKLIYIK